MNAGRREAVVIGWGPNGFTDAIAFLRAGHPVVIGESASLE